MKMMARILIGMAVLLVVFAFGFRCHDVYSTAQAAAKESAMRALAVQIDKTVKSYHEAEGRYPASLDLVSITNFPDGGEPEMINEFHYQSDGSTFSLDWKSLHLER